MQMPNNQMMQLINLARNGGNPMAMLNSMAGSNPQISQALNMMSGKSPQQLQQMAINMANERGININQLASSLGLRI